MANAAIKLYKDANNNKYVGINVADATASLSYNLQVNGTANISGALSANSLSLTTALPVASGGTGRTTLTGSNSLRSDLGFGTGTGALAVANGGTGATTAANARTNLGIGASGTHADSYFALASHDHTRVGIDAIWIYPNNSNEINFGGTNTSSTLYIGYRATDSRPIPTTYIFGSSSSGTATIKAASFVGALTGDVTGSATGLKSLATSSNRLTTADQDPGNCNLNWFHATSSMTTNKPVSDGMILNLGWDNNAPSWTSQLYIANGIYAAGLRFRNASTWQPWVPILMGTHINSSDYWGISFNGTESGYLRMPTDGIIPYTSGAAGSGHSNIGTTGWHFSKAYIDKMYGGLTTEWTITGTSHAVALQNHFNSYKTQTPRNSLIHFYDTTSGNGSATFGYFLDGYNDGPYGGFYVAHYNTPYYVGIQNGTYTQGLILTNKNASTTSNIFNQAPTSDWIQLSTNGVKYWLFLFIGIPGSSTSYSTTTVPVGMITTDKNSPRSFLIADESRYHSFYLYKSNDGSEVYIKNNSGSGGILAYGMFPQI